jgi:hypothetical protein
MTRVLSSACAALVLLGLLISGNRAWAGPKPTIAILGLEVYDNGSGIDPETTRAAKDLTAALRDRAKAGTGPYAPAPGGDKELIDEKLLNNCDTEAPVCMAAIGTELAADLLMYGKIEKSAQNGQPIYKVSIKLLYVSRKQLASSTVETFPLADSTGVRAVTQAKSWYAKLVGVTTGGTLVIKANTDRGTVLIDGETKGNLASGTLTLNGVPEGRRVLVIEAKDRQRYETPITIHTGETLSHNATLVEMSKLPLTPSAQPMTVEGTVAEKPSSSIWKPVFYATAGVDAALIGATLYEFYQSRSKANDIKVPRDDGKSLSNHDCGTSNGAGKGYEGLSPEFHDACTAYSRYKIGVVVSSVVGAAVVGSFFLAFIRDRDHTETQTANRGHKKRRELAITPIVTPDGGGATLRIDW